MGSPVAPSHLTFILQEQCQGYQNLEALYLVKEPSYALCYY